MHPNLSVVAFFAFATSLAGAAPAPYVMVDNSPAALMDLPTAQAMWKESLSARHAKLYPSKLWGFVSEVEGGFDDNRACIITARAMVLPRSGKALVYRPLKTATAFGTQAAATQQQCKALAKAKLKDAMAAVSGALIAP